MTENILALGLLILGVVALLGGVAALLFIVLEGRR